MYTSIKPFVILGTDLLPGELWSPIFDPEYVFKPYYYISTYGRIYSSSRYNGFMRKLILDEHGYYRIQLHLMDGSSRYFPVHRLVLYTFGYISGCEKLQCNHIDTIKTNNHITNLEWCTCKENIQHAVSNGIFGSLAANRKKLIVSDQQVHMVCKCWEEGKSIKEINKLTGVSESNVYNIVCGASRKNISSKYNLQKRLSHQFDIEQMNLICLYFQINKNRIKEIRPKELIIEAIHSIGVEVNSKTYASAYHLYHRDTYKDITDKYEY